MILINSPWLRKIRHWQMATTWMMNSNRDGLHKLNNGGSPQQWWL